MVKCRGIALEFEKKSELSLQELDDLQSLAKESILLDWIDSLDKDIACKSIQVQSYDYAGKRLLFLKIKAELYNSKTEKPLNGIVLLRGHAVAILPIIELNDSPEKKVLCIRQARPSVGLLNCLEIPAGMMDKGENIRQTACRELEEETGLVVDASELKPLLKSDADGYLNSVGLLDERIFLFYVEKKLDSTELQSLLSNSQGQHHENEYISLQTLNFEEVVNEFRDGKSLLAWLLYQNRNH